MKLPLLCLATFLLASAPLFAQTGPGDDTPVGATGGFGGSIQIGSGTYDPYEFNVGRTIVDVTIPNATVPFTYTRVWNSRGQGSPWSRSGWRHNWQWDIDSWEGTSDDTPRGVNEYFYGYIIYYPDGRVVKFHKPARQAGQPSAPPGAPGTYTTAAGIQDRFVVDASQTAAHLYLADGNVVNFGEYASQGGAFLWLTSVDDPHGRRVTVSTDSGGTVITEPGGRAGSMSLPSGLPEPIIKPPLSPPASGRV